jgi:hypothetical protein
VEFVKEFGDPLRLFARYRLALGRLQLKNPLVASDEPVYCVVTALQTALDQKAYSCDDTADDQERCALDKFTHSLVNSPLFE